MRTCTAPYWVLAASPVTVRAWAEPSAAPAPVSAEAFALSMADCSDFL